MSPIVIIAIVGLLCGGVTSCIETAHEVQEWKKAKQVEH